MPNDPFATKEDMESRSQGQITVSSHPFLEKELAAASRLIRNACGWHIAVVQECRYRRVGPFREGVWLPAMEITGVTAVTVDGTVWDAGALSAVEFDHATGWTNLNGRTVDVTFTAGFVTVPEDLVTLTLQVAARALGSPLGLVREQAGTVSVTHSQSGFNIAGGDVLLPKELDTLVPYKLGWLP
jgi:hypothetical protein